MKWLTFEHCTDLCDHEACCWSPSQSLGRHSDQRGALKLKGNLKVNSCLLGSQKYSSLGFWENIQCSGPLLSQSNVYLQKYMLNDWDLGGRKSPCHMLVDKRSGLFVSD